LKFEKRRITTSAIALLLITSMLVPLALVPLGSAHTPPVNLTTNAFITALPDTVGVGQTATIYMWLNRVYGYWPLDSPFITAYAAIGNNYRFHNYQLTITGPNGTNTVSFATIQDTTSNQAYSFTPTAPGTYTLTFNFPGQAYNSTSGDYNSASQLVNDYYLPSSANTTLTVTSSAAPYFQQAPLPTAYWTRPIYGENTNWWTISSNWLGTGAPNYGGLASSYNAGGNGYLITPGDAVGPQTSHIMWTKPVQSGGVVGGNNLAIQGDTWFEGSAYNQRFTNPIIVNGKLYYTEPRSFAVSFFTGPTGPTDCIDLQTGQILWSRADVPAPSFAYIYDVQDPNQHGVHPALLIAASGGGFFGGAVSWTAYDADTGDFQFTITGIPTSTPYQLQNGPNGEQLRYTIFNNGNATKPSYYLCEWNSSRLWDFTGLSPAITNGTNASQGKFFDYLDPVTQNASLPFLNSMPNAAGVTTVQVYYNDIMLCYNGSLPSQGATFMGSYGFSPYTYFAINLNASKGTVGSLAWSNTLQPPAGNLTVLEAGVDPVNRVFTENLREANNFVGYSLDTGAKLWGPTTPQNAMDYYGSPSSGSIQNGFAYGKMYSTGYSGVITCYDTKTGNVLWTYGNGGPGNSTQGGFEVPGHYPLVIDAIGNDVVYATSSEHTVETPIYKGALARAINATTGAEIWTESAYTGEFFTQSFAIADGFATLFNGYDNQIYSIGRGPSATTVDAPKAALASCQSVVISGTVIDTSAGTHQTQVAGNFPHGVPCASDASMSQWMSYVYQQQTMPTNFTGVPVELSVKDSNGNTRPIGTTTTDSSGMYTLTWTPDIPGNFTVYAVFPGTNGYWPSIAETSFNVMQAQATTAAPTAQPSNEAATQMYVLGLGIAIIIVIIIVGAVLALLVRKRP
jgi:hypothetical protein